LAIENGIDKLRINPGNIGDEDRVKAVVEKALEKNIPIRIGVNGGSLEKHILEKYGRPTSEAMVESAMYHVELLEKYGFKDIVISLKSSNVKMMVEAYRTISKLTEYPLHLGVTEAGTAFQGTVKSAIGIGSLLIDSIGATLRVSLTEDPVEEIKVAKEILKVLGLRENGVEIVSCPTCGRTEIDLINLAKKVEAEFAEMNYKIKIAVMGCVVNGPGEAREADYGVAGGKGIGVLFKKGEIIKTVREEEILNELRKMIREDFR
jgi:(E)-4-hydroxy-3-methylbut-2-enyl-diphosphate synthase